MIYQVIILSTSLHHYKNVVKTEVHNLLVEANRYHFNFKFGIPASCSFHECARELHNGTTQRQFVEAAMDAIGQGKVHGKTACDITYNNGSLFKGISLWAFVVDNPIWEDEQYNILPPSDAVVNYMSTLDDDKVIGCKLNSTWNDQD